LTENIIRTVKIQRIINECDGVKTLFFNMREGNEENYFRPKPGQFVMVWVPGVDEVPMSISGYDEIGNWSITIKNVGECTKAIHDLTLENFIGVRGPLGNSFPHPNDKSKKVFLIGGGIGMAALKSISAELVIKNFKFTVIEGARVGNDLIYMDEFQVHDKESAEFHFCTDDGSYGKEGFASDVFKDLIKDFNQTELSSLIVYACGPELMLYALLQICIKNKIEYYASLERIMRCGCGLCGLCALDPVGLLVCKDGPVFNSEELKKIEDFGKFRRDFAGKKLPIK
jgi:dihydroorotate dehydrogenase electron transfer subunit